MDILQDMQRRMANGEYEFAIPHFFEEMAEDDLILPEIEMAIAHGHSRRHCTRAPRGTRYEIVGLATDEREIAVICRINNTGKLLLCFGVAMPKTPIDHLALQVARQTTLLLPGTSSGVQTVQVMPETSA